MKAVATELVAHPEAFSLRPENIDERRSIFSIIATEEFLAKSLSPIVPDGAKSGINGFFNRYPEGLKQLFIKNSPAEARLGDHFHTPVAEGGMGEEDFMFTHIPADSSVTVEQYELGRSTGKIRYNIPSGTIVSNRPGIYHTFTIKGPVSFLQVTENPAFQPDDLRPFVPEEATPEDIRMVQGMELYGSGGR